MSIPQPLLAAACLLALASSLTALPGDIDQVQLEPARDNTIFEDPAGALASGAGDFVIAGNTGQSKTRRALLDFDVAGALPAGATVTGVSLTLTLRQTSAGPHDVSAHRALADWGEGSSVATGGNGAPATSGDATWTDRFYQVTSWSNLGGDFAAAVSASATVDQAGAYTWSSPALVADVQSMLDDPAANHGWFLLSDESQPQTTKLFGSRESSLVSERPVLTIDYGPGPESYCTAGTSGLGCTATLSASGLPSASASSGFVLSATGVESDRDGIFFYGRNGRLAHPFQNGSSTLCVQPPVLRAPRVFGSVAPGACQGQLALDLTAHWSTHPGRKPGPGDVVQAQLWYQSTQGALSDALEFTVCP